MTGVFFFDVLTPHGGRVARYAHAFGTAAIVNLAVAAVATALLPALPRHKPGKAV
ncbi:hypothetical protein [Streptomyces sp. NPDC051636]|uniref:hypothetical protein n=1 Tax=Streptomyces sp. NPDC051636 TaxID=3365663 RepID=UPI00378D9A0A